MQRTVRPYAIFVVAAVALLAVVALSACATHTPVPGDSTAPSISITSPSATNTIPLNAVTVVVQVSGFTLVDKIGQANAPGEGHIVYFMDVDAPTAPDAPAITAAGTYVETTATSYVWPNVSGGSHRFSAELVNNDGTPLVPPVLASITVIMP